MIRKLVLVLFIAAIGALGGVEAYGQDAATLAAALDKNKHKKKDKSKNGVTVSSETYLDIKNVPDIRLPAFYAGHYEDESGGFKLTLGVKQDGTCQGSGEDVIHGDTQETKIAYTLRNARI